MGTYVLTKICICKTKILISIDELEDLSLWDYTHLNCPANSLVLKVKVEFEN